MTWLVCHPSIILKHYDLWSENFSIDHCKHFYSILSPWKETACMSSPPCCWFDLSDYRQGVFTWVWNLCQTPNWPSPRMWFNKRLKRWAQERLRELDVVVSAGHSLQKKQKLWKFSTIRVMTRKNELKKVSKSCSWGWLKDRTTAGVEAGLRSSRVEVEMSPWRRVEV